MGELTLSPGPKSVFLRLLPAIGPGIFIIGDIQHTRSELESSMNHQNILTFVAALLLTSGSCTILRGQEMLKPSQERLGSALQSVLDGGQDLLLEKGKTYEVDRTLRFTKPGQRITTDGAGGIDEFAILRLAPGPTATLVDGMRQKGVVLEG